MKNIMFDLNIIFDVYHTIRSKKYPESTQVYSKLKNNSSYKLYISSSSLDNLEFVKHEELKRDFPELTKNQRMLIIKEFIQDLLSQFEIAKTPCHHPGYHGKPPHPGSG